MKTIAYCFLGLLACACVGPKALAQGPAAAEKPLVWPRAAAGCDHNIVFLKTDGTCVSLGKEPVDLDGWKNMVAIATGASHMIGLKSDGTCLAASGSPANLSAARRGSPGTTAVDEWKEIVAVAGGYTHTVGLKADGTVVVAGLLPSAKEIANWKDVVAIAAGLGFTVGVKRDGTCVAAGDNTAGQCEVGKWTDMVTVGCGVVHTLGLKSDGTVVATSIKSDNPKHDLGQCKEVETWTSVVDIQAFAKQSCALCRDGTLKRCGFDHWENDRAMKWKDIVAFGQGQVTIVGVKSDGTVVGLGKYFTLADGRKTANWDLGRAAGPRVPTGRSLKEPWPPERRKGTAEKK